MQFPIILTAAAIFAATGLCDRIVHCTVTNMGAGNVKYNNCSPADRQACFSRCQSDCGFDYRLWDASADPASGNCDCWCPCSQNCGSDGFGDNQLKREAEAEAEAESLPVAVAVAAAGVPEGNSRGIELESGSAN